MSGLFSPTPSTPNAQQTVAAAGLQVQTSAYGLPVPILFGKNQTTPNLIQMVGFAAHQKVEPSASGGKGGSPSPTSITYTYTVTPLFGLCEGTITSFDTIRKDKESPTSLTGWATFTGSQTTAWAYMTSSFSGEARVYPKIAYIAYQNYDLGTSTGLPNHSVVITGLNPYSTGNSYYDAHPVTIVKQLLTSSQFGIGFTRLDPSVDTAGSTTFWNYCVAMTSGADKPRMLFSPLIKEQRPTAEIINEIIMAANGAFVWSEGYLKIKPYGDTDLNGTSPFAGISYTANTTPVYSLTDNDFMSKKNEDPIRVIRKPRNDTYNQISIEYVDSSTNQYNPSIVEVKDDADIEQFGLRKKDTIKMHFITNKDTAQMVAQLILQKNLSIVNKYQFVLGWRYCLLEPMDLVNITDSNLGFNQKTVRITSISENDQGLLTIEAEDFPLGASSPALYTTGSGQATGTNYGADPGNVNTPFFINPPYFLTPSGQELWMAVSADSQFWGGCTVYASLDNVDYAPIGTIFNKARYGVSTGSITSNSGNINDTTNTLAVDLDTSNGELISTDADGLAAYVTLSAIQTSATSGFELISYQTATSGVGYAFNLSTMKRGVYGTTIQSHASNSQFIRLDDAIFKWLVPSTFISDTQPTYFKFVSTNVFGTVTQDITACTAYSTTIPTQNLPQPTNVVLTITETKG
jgi:hypothetical protein